MRTGYTLLALLGLGLIFDVPIWPKSSNVKQGHYSYIMLTESDSISAIDNYKKTMHLNNIGFYKQFFPLSNQKLTAKTHVWFIVSYVTIALISLLWWNDASEYSRDFVAMFLFLSVGNFFDYLIIYNENYVGPISYNMLAVLFYVIFLLYKGWRQL